MLKVRSDTEDIEGYIIIDFFTQGIVLKIVVASDESEWDVLEPRPTALN